MSQKHYFSPETSELVRRPPTPPRTALCAFGTVRGFTEPASLAMLRRNVIEAAPVTDTFLRVRLTETPNANHKHNSRMRGDYSSVASAAQFPGV